MGCILLPPDRVGHTASIAQQIGVPVLATTHAAILRLEPANAALHVVVGAGKVLPVVALHQVRSQVGEHVEELGEPLPLQLGKRPITPLTAHALTPSIPTASPSPIAP